MSIPLPPSRAEALLSFYSGEGLWARSKKQVAFPYNSRINSTSFSSYDFYTEVKVSNDIQSRNNRSVRIFFFN